MKRHNDSEDKDKVIKSSKLFMQSLQTLFYISHVLFLLQCILMICYFDLIEMWHVIVLEITGIISLISNRFEFDYSEESEDDND